MNPGKLKHRINFEIMQEVVNDNGFYSEDWVAIKSVYADIKTLKGKEYFEAAQTQNENTLRFIIRYTTGLNPDMRISYKGRFFNIESIINDDEANKTLTIIVKEVV